MSDDFDDADDSTERKIPPVTSVPPVDSDAREEEEAFDKGNIDQLLFAKAKRAAYDRHEKLLDMAALALRWAVLFLVGFLLIGVSIWFYHLVAPEAYHWMTKDQQEKLQTILLSGTLSAFITVLGHTVFSPPK